MENFDVGAVVGSILSFAIYHVLTYTSVFCLRNQKMQLSRNIANSLMWLQKHRAFSDAASVTCAGDHILEAAIVAFICTDISLATFP